MNKNEHIKKYLDYYCDRKNITPFAVLLKGKWGCGKTFFIKEYITDKKKFIHVSLYGVAEFTEIKERTIIEMLPLIPEKYNKIINSIYKSIKNIPKVKKWLPADSDELLIDLFLKKNAIVFIFDDLERLASFLEKIPENDHNRAATLFEEIRILNYLNLNLEVKYSFKGWAGLMHVVVFTACSNETNIPINVYAMHAKLKKGDKP